LNWFEQRGSLWKHIHYLNLRQISHYFLGLIEIVFVECKSYWSSLVLCSVELNRDIWIIGNSIIIKRLWDHEAIKEVIIDLNHHVFWKISLVILVHFYRNLISDMLSMDDTLWHYSNVTERIGVHFHKIWKWFIIHQNRKLKPSKQLKLYWYPAL
jgi:hypothetical protein